MCDYSLEHYRSRLAAVGEKLMVHQFTSQTIGMIGAPVKAETLGSKLARVLMSKLEWDNQCPVCLQPGTELAFSAPIALIGALNNNRYCTAKFVQLDHVNHCDAIELPDGKQYLLQYMKPGQTCTVLQLPNTKQIDEQIKTSDEQAHDFEAVGRALNHARERERIAREIARERLHHSSQWDHAPRLDVRWVRDNPALEPLDRVI